MTMDSLFSKSDKSNKTKGGGGKVESPPKPTDVGDIHVMLEKLWAKMNDMEEKMAPLQALASDVTLLQQATEESKQAANAAVQAVKHWRTTLKNTSSL